MWQIDDLIDPDKMAALLSKTEQHPPISLETKETLYAYGFQFYQNGQYQKATHFFRFLTAVDIKNKRNWMGLGAALLMQKQLLEAQLTYEFALGLDEQDPTVYLHLSECYWLQHNQAAAEKALSKAEKFAKNSPLRDNLERELAILRKMWFESIKEEK